jgi:hypothetical protein
MPSAPILPLRSVSFGGRTEQTHGPTDFSEVGAENGQGHWATTFHNEIATIVQQENDSHRASS